MTLRSIFTAIALLAASTAAAAQQPPVAAVPTTGAHLQTPDEALAQDAGEYARANAVPLDEAERRLAAQEQSVAVTDAIAQRYRDRLAGIAIEHRPTYQITVLLTGWDPVPDQVVEAGGMAVPIVFRIGAPATRAQLAAAIKQHQAAIRAALPHPPGIGVDLRTGELVIIAAGADTDLYGADELTQRFAAMTGVPVRIRAIDRTALDFSSAALKRHRPAPPPRGAPQSTTLRGPDRLPQMMPLGGGVEERAGAAPGSALLNQAINLAPDLPVEGGARVVGVNPLDGRRYACTTGFVVTDGARTGIATAAHCPDTLSLIDTDGRQIPLSFVGQWGWGYQDVQVNVSDQPLAPLFYADTAKTLARPVTYRRTSASTRAGDYVCHRGERTGYSCSTVELVDFAPAGDLCGGACLPTWITAAGPTCQGGDSGAPVFAGTGAFGIVKGGSYRGDGSCAFYFYMSTDYLPTGWSLLEQGVPPASLP